MFIASGALREPTFARGACDGSSCIEYYVLQQASCDPEKNQEREEAPPKEKHISIGETVSAANPDAKHCAPKRDERSAANPQHVPIIERCGEQRDDDNLHPKHCLQCIGISVN